MWPFKKPELNGNLLFLVAYRNSDYQMDISEKFMKTLTRKQIRLLNKTFDIKTEEWKCDAELLREQEKQAAKDKVKSIADEKRKDNFEEKDHNLGGSAVDLDSDYAQYIKNNADKAMLSPEEEERLMKMFSGIQSKIKDAQEKIKTEPHTKYQKDVIENISEFFLNSAKDGKK